MYSGVEIIVNVYDLNPGLNSTLYPLGLGLYHSGIQIGLVEYTFAQHDGKNTGVMQLTPKSNHPNFRESIVLGRTLMSSAQIQGLLDKLKSSFSGQSYDILKRNCNSFCEAFVKGLLGRGLPGWINRLANLGKGFYEIGGFFTMQKFQDLDSGLTPNRSPFQGKGVTIG